MRACVISPLARIVVGMVLLGLAGCVGATDPARIAIPKLAMAFPAGIAGGICTRTISGGEESGTMTLSNAELAEALRQTLAANALAALPGACRQQLDVELLGLSYAAGFDSTFNAYVNYKLYAEDGRPLLLETISSTFAEPFRVNLSGSQRFNLSKEGAVRENLRDFLTRLAAVRLPG